MRWSRALVLAGLAVVFIVAGVLYLGLPGSADRVPGGAQHYVQAIMTGKGLFPCKVAEAWSRRERPGGLTEYTNALTAGNAEICGRCMITVRDGALLRVSWRVDRLPDASNDWLALDEAWSVAESFAQPLLAHTFGPDVTALKMSKPTRPSESGDAYLFAWSNVAGGPTVTVGVNAFTGSVTAVEVELPSPTSLKSEEDTSAVRAQAIPFLNARLAERGLPSFDSLDVVFDRPKWFPSGNTREFWWHVCVALEEIPAEGASPLRLLWAEVNPAAGGTVHLRDGEEPADIVRLAKRHNILLTTARERLGQAAYQIEAQRHDCAPLWCRADDKVLFLTNRPLTGYPDWREVPRYAAVVIGQAQGTMGALSFHEHLPCMCIAASRNTDWIAYRYTSMLTLVNAVTGVRYTLDQERAALPAPISMASTKPWVVGPAGAHDGTVTWRWFRPPETESGRLAATTVRGLHERDSAVCLNSQDNAAAIVTQVRDPRGSSYTVSLAPVSDAGEFGDRRSLLTELNREPIVSWMADGDRILADIGGDRQIVNVATGDATSLALPELADPDTAGILRIDGAVVAAAEDMVLFAARSGEWPAERGSRIYECKLDGSALRRLTPLGNDAVAVYRLPETGAPAFEFFPAAQE